MPEFFGSLQAAGHSLLLHHLDFVQRSGVADEGHIAREHWSTTEALRLMATHDQYDLSMSAGADLLARRLVVLELAVARSPRNPNWNELDVVMSRRVSETGGAVVASFESWLSGMRKGQASTMKQTRMWQEERTSDAKRRKGGPGDGKGNNDGGAP